MTTSLSIDYSRPRKPGFIRMCAGLGTLAGLTGLGWCGGLGLLWHATVQTCTDCLTLALRAL